MQWKKFTNKGRWNVTFIFRSLFPFFIFEGIFLRITIWAPLQDCRKQQAWWGAYEISVTPRNQFGHWVNKTELIWQWVFFTWILITKCGKETHQTLQRGWAAPAVFLLSWFRMWRIHHLGFSYSGAAWRRKTATFRQSPATEAVAWLAKFWL